MNAALALAVPVREGEAKHLAALLSQVRKLGCFSQVAVANDGFGPPLTLLRCTQSRRPGADYLTGLYGRLWNR